jgi:type I restriction enzyme S subunit
LPPPKSPTGVPFITIGNIVKETRTIDFSDTFTVPHTSYDALKENRRPRKGDVLFTVTGSFGIPVIVTTEEPFCFQRHIAMVRPRQDTDSAWLYYALLSPHVFRQADEAATGTAQRTVSLKVLRSLRVPRVPFAEQRVIAARLSNMRVERRRG